MLPHDDSLLTPRERLAERHRTATHLTDIHAIVSLDNIQLYIITFVDAFFFSNHNRTQSL